jgi:outer membrane immunogenic protein
MNTMKSVFMTAGLSLAASGAVMAADMPMYGKAPAPVAYDWTGLYFGGHIGGGWETQTFNDPVGFNALNGFIPGAPAFSSGPAGPKVSSSSFLGGLQAGANYQIGRLVLGSEFDVSWASLNSSVTGGLVKSNQVAVAGFNGTESFTSSSHVLATATTRLGVARDTWLFYGKAGAAWTRTGDGVSTTETGPAPGFVPATLAGSLSDTRVGWTVGTGIEWAFARNWTTKLEYDYIDFGTKVENIAASGTAGSFLPPGTPFGANLPVSVSQNVSMVKWGVNYKFDPGFLFW